MQLKGSMQKISFVKLQLFECVSTDLAKNFLEWRSKLSEVRDIRLNRFVLKTKWTDLFDLHIPCDASKTGYGACINVVDQDEQGSQRLC